MNRLTRHTLLGASSLAAGLFGRVFPGKAALYRFDIWLDPWLRRRLELDAGILSPPAGAPRHLLFCFVDHFEPGTRGASLERARDRFAAWTEGYPSLARRFTDNDGRHPQHGFFFPPHYFRDEYMKGLAEFDWLGVGETELHLHHEDDSGETLRALLEETLERYADYGIFQCQGDPVRRAYGFIHGNWALDNSRPQYCGVDDELTILRETGCYGDFTFPSLYSSQPRRVNALYRALDDPNAPKSYNDGPLMTAGRTPAPEEFAMITGPIGLAPKRRFPFFRVEDADVTGEGPGSPERVRRWVGEHIHVAGRPEWVFVKVHTHGAPERHRHALLGEDAARMYQTLCEEYGDGERWRLHFVNAREMYNMARAAEDGHAGDPGLYRDYEIPAYLTRSIRSDARYRARSFMPASGDGLPLAELHLAEPGTSCTMEFKTGGLVGLRGALARMKSRADEAGGGRLLLTGDGELELVLAENLHLLGTSQDEPVDEGRFEHRKRACRRWRVRLEAGRAQGYRAEIGTTRSARSALSPSEDES